MSLMIINFSFLFFIFLWLSPFNCICDIETFLYILSNLHFLVFALYKITNVLSMTITAAIIIMNTDIATATTKETYNNITSYIK